MSSGEQPKSSASAEFALRAEAIKRSYSGELRAVRPDEPGDPVSESRQVIGKVQGVLKRRISDTARPLAGDSIGEQFPLEIQRQIVDLVATARRDRVEFYRMFREFQENPKENLLFVCLSIRLSGRPLVWKGREWKVKYCREELLKESHPLLTIHRPRLSDPSDRLSVEEDIPLIDVLAGLKV